MFVIAGLQGGSRWASPIDGRLLPTKRLLRRRKDDLRYLVTTVNAAALVVRPPNERQHIPVGDD
jgi:hypothetical protein